METLKNVPSKNFLSKNVPWKNVPSKNKQSRINIKEKCIGSLRIESQDEDVKKHFLLETFFECRLEQFHKRNQSVKIRADFLINEPEVKLLTFILSRAIKIIIHNKLDDKHRRSH